MESTDKPQDETRIDIMRRRTVQGIALGAVGLGFGLSPIAVRAQDAARPTRKLIVRADDIGMSNVYNIGAFEAVENGVVTSADIMLDCPGSVDALERMRAYPWISFGWHMHMWGAPVTEAARVPSLIEKEGEFAGRFRTDLSQAEDVNYDEALLELRAQLDRAVRILGKVPDTGGNTSGTSPWRQAVKKVHDDYGIPYAFASQNGTSAEYQAHIDQARERGEAWAQFYPSEPRPATVADERWADRKIWNAAGTEAYVDLLTDSISSVEANYDPVLFYTEDRAGILTAPEDVIFTQSWHPGYVDYNVYRLVERVARPRAQQFVVGRVQDAAAMTDPRLREWIKANNVELINFRDALYGTADYQNHLRQSGSDLAVGV